MLSVPAVNKFLFSAGTFTSTGPTTDFGTSVLTGAGTYGAWVQIVAAASITEDCYALMVCFNTGAGASRSMLANIGIDPAGGTSYTIIAPDLFCGNCGVPNQTTGVRYWFPIRVPAGASVAVQVNFSSEIGIQCGIEVFGKPTNPEMMKYGSKVIAYGVSGLNGVTVTPGSGSKGSWAELGTIAAGDKPFYFEYGVHITDTTMNILNYHCDVAIGDASNKVLAVANGFVTTTAAESIAKAIGRDGYHQAAPGDKIYGRMAGSTSPDTGVSMAAYGVIG